MFEKILSRRFHINRHRNGPYAVERERYLAFLAAEGRSKWVLRAILFLLYSLAEWLPLHLNPIASEQIRSSAKAWSATLHRSEHNRHRAETWFIFHATNWLRFLGRLQEPAIVQPFAAELGAFLHFEEHERGFSPATLKTARGCLREFLTWATSEVKTLRATKPEDISRYFTWLAAHHRWQRTTIAMHATSLRNFFRFAQSQGWCVPDLANAIDAPRIYKLERPPRAAQWSDVRRLLLASSENAPCDTRDHAMLLLFSVYGFRSGEVRHLCLEDIDWEQEVIRVRRPKQRKTQRYPLAPAVGEAIVRYLREERPRCPRREVFLTRTQPFRPLAPTSLGSMIRRRCRKLGLVLPCYGPHAFRHSCATRLLAEGFSLKEIGDHLGHVSLAATQMYAKVDLNALSEVGQFDLSSLVDYAERSARVATPIYARGSLEALQAVATISLGGLL
jgi:integrase/recombinase XerD